MSDRMSVAEARKIAGRSTGYSPVKSVLAARTVVEQAEQIERLQTALNEIEDWGVNVVESLVGVGIILPGDMDPPA